MANLMRKTKAELVARIEELELINTARTRVNGFVSIGVGELRGKVPERPGEGTVQFSNQGNGLTKWIERNENGTQLEFFIRG